MSDWIYQKKLYESKSNLPFTISRSKLELLENCPRCFYMDCRLGIGRPGFPPFTLNSAVDNLLKNEFDLLRKSGQKHALMEQYGIDAIPYDHEDLPKWRGEVTGYRYIGISCLHEPTNFKITGMVDDVWQDSHGKLCIVDYKATSTTKQISLDDQWKQGYKRQMEVYQWIFRQCGYNVSDTGYFVFANAKKDLERFDGKLEFEMSILTHEGKDSWVEGQILKAKTLLDADQIPAAASECEYCTYRRSSVEQVSKFLKLHQ